jgi:hypothetical protein
MKIFFKSLVNKRLGVSEIIIILGIFLRIGYMQIDAAVIMIKMV